MAGHQHDDGAGASDACASQKVLAALQAHFSADMLERCRSAPSPLNVLVELRSSTGQPSKHDVKQHADLVKGIMHAFSDSVPTKPDCRRAFELLDALHQHTLSQARIRSRALRTIHKGDMNRWAKEQGDNIHKLLMWCWRLRAKSSASADPVLQNIKDIMKPRPRLRPPTTGRSPSTFLFEAAP